LTNTKNVAEGDKSVPDRMTEADEAHREAEKHAAEDATAKAEAEGRLPETMALTNPAPATEMDGASGAFIEPEIKAAREGTSALQNGGDFNDPRGRHPSDPNFAGQGLDLSVYGKAESEK